MKKVSILFLSLFITVIGNAQRKSVDSLYLNLKNADSDTARIIILIALNRHYHKSYPDSGIIVSQQAYNLAAKHNWVSAMGRSLVALGSSYSSIGDYVKAMQFYFSALKIAESINDVRGASLANSNIGATYVAKGDYKSAMPYLRQAEKQLTTYSLSHKFLLHDQRLKAIIWESIGNAYLEFHQIDSAEYYFKICDGYARAHNFVDIFGPVHSSLGEIEADRGNKTAALKDFREAVEYLRAVDDVASVSYAYLSIANLYHKHKQQDSAEYYAQKALETAMAAKFEQIVLDAGKVLYAYYDEDHNLPQAYKYFKLTAEAKDSLYSQDKIKQLLSISFDEKQRQQDVTEAKNQYQNKVRIYALIAGLAILLLLVFIFWRNSSQRQAANRLLKKQKEDIESALVKLQLTQTRLIQSEKMASLGELTAGIAHEIQNPLNFVNNFSDVNKEMLEELKAESIKPKAERDEQLEIELINDLIENEEKINHHGKRADFIVKGMLQHSRTNTGERQPTNINSLADEFLNLSYHGLRTKDKSFNAELVTHFDEKLPKINVVSQDIGRVLLNLFNNAFYAVNQKKKTAAIDYKPEVTVSTASKNGQVTIIVKDNGVGIPEQIKEKIMQPFFTTKPTGEGTGLGLSLTYDMVVKGHGGSIDLISKEGEGSQFIITLPTS